MCPSPKPRRREPRAAQSSRWDTGPPDSTSGACRAPSTGCRGDSALTAVLRRTGPPRGRLTASTSAKNVPFPSLPLRFRQSVGRSVPSRPTRTHEAPSRGRRLQDGQPGVGQAGPAAPHFRGTCPHAGRLPPTTAASGPHGHSDCTDRRSVHCVTVHIQPVHALLVTGGTRALGSDSEHNSPGCHSERPLSCCQPRPFRVLKRRQQSEGSDTT